MFRILKPQRLVPAENLHSNCQPTLPPAINTEQSINNHITALCKNHHFKEALRAFQHLPNNPHFAIWPSTYARLISACSTLKSLKLARIVHSHLTNSKARQDVILQNHIVSMYGKCGSLEHAKKLFDEMPERNVVSWASMIAGYSQNFREKEAMRMYLEMRGSGFTPDQFVFGSVIRACVALSDLELGKQLHAQVLKSEFGFDLIPQNALVAMYTKSGEIDYGWEVFYRIYAKDLISWSSMIGGLVQRGCELEGLHLFKEMLSLGVYSLNEFVFASAFSACSGILQSDYGSEIHGLSVKFGLQNNAFASCSLCDMYAKCGRLDSAKKAFYQIEKPDLVSWNAIIAAFAYSGNSDESLSLFSQMRYSGFVPDEVTILCVLCSFNGFCTLYQGKQVHSYVIKMGLDVEVPVCNTLLTMYAHCSDLSDALNIFNDMRTGVDLVSWNAILTACLHHNRAYDVFQYLKLMHKLQYKPDQTTVINVVGACALLPSLEMGYQIHNYATKSGYETETSVANGLIDMYTKCGVLPDARKLFEIMVNPDVVSWSSLIVGYAQFGYGDEALTLFQTMRKKGIQPNHITFVGVLSACTHVGLVEDGYLYYKTMECDYGIVPTREHENCVVDMLARAGHLRQAEKFISQMSVEPDIVVWKTLLSACQTHKDAEVGHRAAERVLEMDPCDSAAHVLLCNIYASSGSWDDVARVRKSMRSRGVRKVPGQSWIEVSGGVHVFSVEDRSHPKMDEIYSLLEDVWLEFMGASSSYILDQESAAIEAPQE